MLPGLARVHRLVNAIARRKIGPDDSSARADVDHIGIGRRYRGSLYLIEPVGCRSNNGTQVEPKSVDRQTPPLSNPI